METHRPPELGGGGVANRRLPPNRGIDALIRSNPKLPDNRPSGHKIFRGSAPLVRVRYALTREQWIWLRWLCSAQGGWV